MKVLLTGFTKFIGIQVNPTEYVMRHKAQQLQEALAPHSIHCHVLQTEYAKSGEEIVKLVDTYQPDLVVSLGVSARAKAVKLERTAQNLDNANIADNAGEVRSEHPIVAGGAPMLVSNMALEQVHESLGQGAVPTEISDNAGTYVCNHVYYILLDHIKRSEKTTLGLFVHIPLLSDVDSGVETDSEISSSDVVDFLVGLVRCVEAVSPKV